MIILILKKSLLISAASTILLLLLSSQSSGDTLEVTITFYPARNTTEEPNVEDVIVKANGKTARLVGDKSGRTWKSLKREICNRLQIDGSKNQQIEVEPKFFGGERYMTISPMMPTIDHSHGKITIDISFFDGRTYYGELINEAKNILSKARTQSVKLQNDSLLRYFEILDNAAQISGRDNAHARAFVEGLCLVASNSPPSPEMRQHIRNWFQWSCLERKEDDLSSVRTDLSRLADAAAQPVHSEWRAWIAEEVVDAALTQGIIPRYGHNTLCDQLISNGEPELGFKISLKMLDESIIHEENFSGILKNWFERSERAMRMMDDPTESLALIREKVEDRLTYAGRSEKRYLDRYLNDLIEIERK